jgi:hypothetical protein
MVNPDLTFYGYINDNIKNYVNENKYLYTILKTLYADKDLTQKIGFGVVDGTQTTYNETNAFSETEIYSLPEGTITTFLADAKISPNNSDIFTKGEKSNSRILNTTGKFSFATGYIIFEALSTNLRYYQVYFDSSIIRAIQN